MKGLGIASLSKNRIYVRVFYLNLGPLANREESIYIAEVTALPERRMVLATFD
jgi:hypothetical protein